MPYLNPLANALLQGQQSQQQLATDKTRQVRRAQVQVRATGATGDTFEHQVESTEELSPIHDEQPQKREQRSKKRRAKRSDNDVGPSDEHLDIKA